MISQEFTPPVTLSVVLSFYNEADVLPELLRRIRAVFRPMVQNGILTRYDLVFVNDASTDQSLPILLDQAKEGRDIKIVNLSRRFGVAPGVMAGFAHAQGDLVVYMDADLQDPPELIPELVKRWEAARADVVHTVRLSRKGESRYKLWITKFGYYILNRFSSIKLPIEAGDFKLLTQRAVKHVLALDEQSPFVRGLICWIGFKQEFLPYHREARLHGDTKYPVLSQAVIHNFFNSALISFSAAPLRISLFFSYVGILFSVILMCHVIMEKIFGKAIPGWTAIMIPVLFLGSLQLLCIGIIGLYVYSTYQQSKQRPLYIVESTVGFDDVRSASPLAPTQIRIFKAEKDTV